MSKFKKGDKVRVRSDAMSQAHNSFIPAMEDTPGMEGTVEAVGGSDSYDVTLSNGDSWFYMASELEAA